MPRAGNIDFPSPQRMAFSLVELLVLVAIIALLVAILVPPVQQARNLAKISNATSC